VKPDFSDLNFWDNCFTELAGVDFRKANLTNASLFYVNLQGANLESATLEGADLSNTNLREANLKKADLSFCMLLGTDFFRTDLTGACFIAALSENLDLRHARLAENDFTEAVLKDVNLDEARCSDIDFTKANLTRARLNKVVFENCCLKGAKLEFASLDGAMLNGANMDKAILSYASMISANLVGTTLELAHLEGANLRKANLSECNLIRAYLPNAVLEGANLAGADLTGADLSGANLGNASLERANLSQTNLSAAYLRNARLDGANLREANLEGADLAKANMTGVDLSEANLQSAVLITSSGMPANMSKTILRGTKFTKKADSRVGRSFLELASADGLETAIFDDPQFLERYLAEAFEFAHREGLEEKEFYPKVVQRVLNRIKALRNLFLSDEPREELILAVKDITAELIKYLAKHPDALYKIKPRQFEELIAEILTSYGWRVQLTAPTKDGGFDIFAINKDPSQLESAWIIECKKYSAKHKVGVGIARGLYGVMTDLRFNCALLTTTSYFTKGAEKFAASRYGFELRDYEGILEWINEYKPNPNGRLYIKDNRLVIEK